MVAPPPPCDAATTKRALACTASKRSPPKIPRGDTHSSSAHGVDAEEDDDEDEELKDEEGICQALTRLSELALTRIRDVGSRKSARILPVDACDDDDDDDDDDDEKRVADLYSDASPLTTLSVGGGYDVDERSAAEGALVTRRRMGSGVGRVHAANVAAAASRRVTAAASPRLLRTRAPVPTALPTLPLPPLLPPPPPSLLLLLLSPPLVSFRFWFWLLWLLMLLVKVFLLKACSDAAPRSTATARS